MKNKNLLIISLILLAAVLLGVSVIEPLTSNFEWIIPFAPMIVITGFFTFLVSVSLFVYVVISNFKK